MTKLPVENAILPAMKHVCQQGQPHQLVQPMDMDHAENNLDTLQAYNLQY